MTETRVERHGDAERLIALLSGCASALETLAEADWQRIVALAQEHSVAPMLYARLQALGVTLPAATAQPLRKFYLANVMRNTKLFHEVGKILRALQAAGIPVIPLKGVCLAEAVYGNLALRQIGDVDLLVPPANLATALEVLRTLGYAAAQPFDIEGQRQVCHHMPPLSRRGGATLELHWTIAKRGSNIRLEDTDLDQLWSRAIPSRIDGVQILMLSPTDLLLHLCLHASVHHYFDGIGLSGFWDMALVIRRYGEQIDWEQFTTRAHQWGVANGAYLALQLTQEWTGVVIPTPVMRSLMPATLNDAAIEWVRHKILDGISPALQNSDVARLGKARIADKVAALRDTLFPPRHVMASMYHAPADSWRILCYYPVRFKDLWMRYGQVVWRLLRRDKTLTTEARQEAHLRDYLGSR